MRAQNARCVDRETQFISLEHRILIFISFFSFSSLQSTLHDSVESGVAVVFVHQNNAKSISLSFIYSIKSMYD